MKQEKTDEANVLDLRIQLQDALVRTRQAVEHAEAVEKSARLERKNFVHSLAVVAHELRNPLGSIRNAAAILGCNDRDEALRARLIIERQIGQMGRMIDDLLDLSRANAGKLSLMLEPVRLHEIVERAAEGCSSALDRRRQRLLVHGNALEHVLHADPLRLLQILGNILDNASKYSADCTAIHLDVLGFERDVALSVKDCGIGIPPEALDRIFEPFVQEVRAATFDRSGLGVGLAVVRELVEAHGGSVIVESGGIGCGACFVVTLPRWRHPVEIDRT